MAIGIDGYIEQRIETLYVSDEYKLFFLTGQKNGNSWRRAYITAKPFHALDAESVEQMRTAATVWSPSGKTSVEISAAQGQLSFHDTCTGTTSSIPWSELDQDVQDKLRGNVTDAFAKYAAKKTAPANDAAQQPARAGSKTRTFSL